MVNAKIINNRPICSKCGNEELSGVREYKEVVMGNLTYTMFINHCYKCKEDNRYLADITLDRTLRYEITDVIKDVNGN